MRWLSFFFAKKLRFVDDMRGCGLSAIIAVIGPMRAYQGKYVCLITVTRNRQSFVPIVSAMSEH